MIAQTHIIRKQVLDLKLSSRAAAFHLQQKARNHFDQQLLPVLEKIFSELSDPGETIQIDKLEIDLGILTLKNMEAGVWDDEIYRILKTQIGKQLKTTAATGGAKHITGKQNAGRQWLFYMEHGCLSWNALTPNEKWYNEVLESLATDFALVVDLRKLIRQNNNALKRIVGDHPVSFLLNLIAVLTARKMPQLSSLADEVTAMLFYWFTEVKKMNKSRNEISLPVWQQIIRLSAVEPAGSFSEKKIIETIIGENLTAEISVIALERLKDKLPLTVTALKEVAAKKTGDSTDLGQEDLPTGNRIEEPTVDGVNHIESIDKEGLFVQHAGLVLLHPFLSMFFNRLGLIEKGNFSDNNCRQKAILLLHYLVTGNTDAKEYELLMPKIICGWPLQSAVLFTGEITAAEMEEADNLLQSLIEKWDKLKNTSAGALRENFLQRNGKVVTKNDTLFVQVETGSLDILLDFLPWGIGVIKLPWMKEMIRVEWR